MRLLRSQMARFPLYLYLYLYLYLPPSVTTIAPGNASPRTVSWPRIPRIRAASAGRQWNAAFPCQERPDLHIHVVPSFSPPPHQAFGHHPVPHLCYNARRMSVFGSIAPKRAGGVDGRMASIEEKVEERCKAQLDALRIRHYGKTEKVNESIASALAKSPSKSGGSGSNYPDIQLLLDDGHGRRVPVMIEAKGLRNRLERRSKDGSIELVTTYDKDAKPGKDGTVKYHAGDENWTAVQNYAVNGAIHYANAILDSGDYDEAIAIGINGTKLDATGCVLDPECRAYYVSSRNNRVPKHIEPLDESLDLLAGRNLPRLYALLDRLTLTDAELEELTRRVEASFETKIKAMHQALYDDERLRTLLSTNEKLYLFCGLIMGGMSVRGVLALTADRLYGNDDPEDNDGTTILTRIKSFLSKNECPPDKMTMILDLLRPVFEKRQLWRPVNGESILRSLFKQVQRDIVPSLEGTVRIDFTGRILNSINDWVSIDNDKRNDVVLTPRYVTKFMAQLAKVDMDSFVWDRAMGSGGFLVAALDLMVKDAEAKIHDADRLAEKIEHIKRCQLLGVEILGNIYILAVLNIILMGGSLANLRNGDGHLYGESDDFPANVFLLNPPYSADGKGFNFVQEALSHMTKGRGVILIQENAGSGNGLPYTRDILKDNALVASIHMADIFCGKASVQTAVYVFDVGKPHDKDDLVTFIDMGEDGYSRQNRKKSSQEVNLRDTDHAAERYAEVVAIVNGKKPATSYYTKENGKVFRDVIGLSGDDWTVAQHKVIDTTPTEADFKRTVADYLAWRVGKAIKGE